MAPRCDNIYFDVNLDAWLKVDTLSQNVVLSLIGEDLYDSHTALRHLAEVDKAGYKATVELPMSLRKHRAFTPWLTEGHTESRPNSSTDKTTPVVMSFYRAPPQHVQDKGPHTHKASFDVRIGGAMVRTLLDTGADTSVISKKYLDRVGIPYQRTHHSTGSVGGIGNGNVKTYGFAQVAVKMGKYHPVHQFHVVPDSVSGYDCIIGDEFLHPYGVAIEYHDTTVKAKMFVGKENEYIALQRKVAPPEFKPNISSFTQQSGPEGPGSWKEMKRLNHDISSGAQVAYRIHLLAKDGPSDTTDTVSGTDSESKGKGKLPPEIQKVLQKHSGEGGTLAGKIPPHTHAVGFECHIELIDGARPVYIRQYRLTPLEREELLARVEEFIAKGWIEPSSSSWCSSGLFVPKPNGKLRFCVDFRHLNARTSQNRTPLPHQGELLDKLQGSHVFSALDLASGFYQITMAPDSRAKTAFPTPLGLYQWCVMPMGLCNAPAIFQQAMNTILKKHILAGYCLVYLDDVVIKSQNLSEHAVHLDQVLTSLKQHNLFCQLPKCTWAQSQFKYLGHLVTGQGVEPDPAKLKALIHWEPPLSVVDQLAAAELANSQKESTVLKEKIATECRRFLGFMNYFNRFIPRYSDLACDLHKHTQKSPPVWTPACTEAWNKLKACLLKATMMYHPDFSLPFHVYSDASTKAVGGVLIQFQDGVAHPVAYVARKLTSAEVNYTTTEQEMLAFVYCFTQWRCYLEGSQVLLHTDHEPLTWLATQDRPNRRQARWLEFLSGFRYEILYVKGDQNVVADALSRMLSPPEGSHLKMPGDDWPPVSQQSHVYSYSFRMGLPAQRGGRHSAASAASVVSHSSAGDQTQFAPSDRQSCFSELTAEGRRCSTRRSCLGDGTSAATGATSGCDGYLASPIHRHVFLGGFTRRSATTGARGAVQPAGGDDAPGRSGPTKRSRTDGMRTASLPLKKRVTFADRHTVHNQPMSSAVPVSSTDPQSVSELSESGMQPETGQQKGRGHGGRATDDERTTDTHHATIQGEGNPSELDPPQVTSHLAPETDPSLSAYELLAEQLFDRIRAGTRADDSIQTESQLQKYQLSGKGDLLWRGNLLYVPNSEELRQDILYWHHDVPWCGHLGIKKTLELVQRQFWWPSIAADIKSYVQSCYKCQSDKPDRRKRRPPLTFIEAPGSCWRTIGVDMIVDLTPSGPEGFNAIVVFCCHLSKMVRLIPSHTTLTTEGFVDLFFREIFPHYGMPTKIVSDRGSQWNSMFFRSLCDRADIRLSLSTAHHPQTNGLVERTNEVVETALRHYVAPEENDWNKKIPFIEFALNDMKKDASGVTPFRMNRITVPLAPFEAVKDRIATQKDITYPKTELCTWMGVTVPRGERTLLQAQEEFSRARQSVHWAKCKMKEAHDRKGVVNQHYTTGQLVWLNTKHISLRHPSLRHKFSPKYVGPVKVLELSQNGSTVLLEMPSNLQIHPRVSVTLVKPYVARDNTEVQPVWIDGAQEWEVEAVISHNIVSTRSKKVQKFVEFLVQWKGSCEPSWHELKDCENCIETVEKYLTLCTKGTRAKIYRAIPPAQMIWFSETFQREALNQ